MADGKIDIEDPQVLVALNVGIAEATMSSSITPYVAWARVQKVLANYHVFIPNAFLEGADGHEVTPINQFGKRYGQTNDGDTVVRDESDLFLYFEWEMTESGLFKIFAEVVNGEDLDEILADYDAEVDEINEASELKMGMKDEMEEHGMTKDEAKKTAKDHLKKNKRYYSIMKKVGLEEAKKMKNDPCWNGYEMVGMKNKKGKKVPNCVPVSEAVFGGDGKGGKKYKWQNPNNAKTKKSQNEVDAAMRKASNDIADTTGSKRKWTIRKMNAAYNINAARKNTKKKP